MRQFDLFRKDTEFKRLIGALVRQRDKAMEYVPEYHPSPWLTNENTDVCVWVYTYVISFEAGKRILIAQAQKQYLTE